MDLDDYDRLIASIYDAGATAGDLCAMFERIRLSCAADTSGISVYDETDSVITHTLTWPHRGLDGSLADRVRALNDDAGARLVTGARLRRPQRFSDVVPGGRLRHASWFRAQAAMTGLGHGVAADVIVARDRLRVFAMRGADRVDFLAAEVDLLGRIAGHVGRAFAGALGRLAPDAVPAGIGLLVYHEDRLAAAFGSRPDATSHLARFGLTAAEARVLAVMSGGRSRQAGAAALGIGVNSLKSHMRRIYAKTGTRRLPELMQMLRAPLPDEDVSAPQIM